MLHSAVRYQVQQQDTASIAIARAVGLAPFVTITHYTCNGWSRSPDLFSKSMIWRRRASNSARSPARLSHGISCTRCGSRATLLGCR